MREASSDTVLKRLADSAGRELVERVLALDARRLEAQSPQSPTGVEPRLALPDKDTSMDWDVVLAGGGLSLVLAPLLARNGLRVAVVEPFVAGRAHREWNASAQELEVLITSGLLTPDELKRCITARYEYGICRFHGGSDHPVTGVLDHAVDAGTLLSLVRTQCEKLGVTFLDGHKVTRERGSESGVVLEVGNGDGQTTQITCRVLVDARGASSPYASADLICPTVGGVLANLAIGDAPDEVNPSVGDILVTTEGAQKVLARRNDKTVEVHRQYVWEGFPGHPGEVTVYLFYYGLASESASLVSLYDSFFQSLPNYKRGDARLVRPTFGFIPGWSRNTPPPSSPHPRIVLMGDAAARHSPLTFCGFGAMLRSFVTAAEHVTRLAEATDLTGSATPSRINTKSNSLLGGHLHDTELHRWTGGLAYLLARGKLQGDDSNRLLDAAFATLQDMGNDAYAALLRDEMGPAEFVQFLRATSKKRPQVYRDVFRSLGMLRLSRWGIGLAKGYAQTRAVTATPRV